MKLKIKKAIKSLISEVAPKGRCWMSQKLSGGKWVGWVKVKVLVSRWCLTLCDPMDCSPPGSSIHGIFQAKILQWVAILYFRGCSQPRINWACCIAGRFFTVLITREAQMDWVIKKKKKWALNLSLGHREFVGRYSGCILGHNPSLHIRNRTV